MILDKIKARGEEMAPLEGHDRLQYLIDIAREVKPLEDKDKIDENKIRGCASNWVVGKVNETVYVLQTRCRCLDYKRYCKNTS